MRQVEPSFLIQSTSERLAFGTAPGSTSRSSTAVAERVKAAHPRAAVAWAVPWPTGAKLFESLASECTARFYLRVTLVRCAAAAQVSVFQIRAV
jgi:hypothetical protein